MVVSSKRRHRALKVKRVSDMDIVTDEKEISSAKDTTGHSLHQEKAAKTKQIKQEIAKLKEARKRLSKKDRDQKKKISREIKDLLKQINMTVDAEMDTE
jgi:phosphoglycerate-specific signal transduction histidine kinase